MTLIPDTNTADGLWLSMSAIAQRKGVTRQTISEIVAKLVEEGKLKLRPGSGKRRLVNLAEYDRVRGETTDLTKAQGAQTKAAEAGPTPRDPTFTQAQAAKATYEAELKRLDLDERVGRLVDKVEVERRLFRIFRATRDRFLNLPARVTERMLSAGDERAARQVLDQAVRQDLDRLAKDLDSQTFAQAESDDADQLDGLAEPPDATAAETDDV